jgi:glycosyltransferase involved in cell wall biosynthesis
MWFARILKNLGHTVFLYASEENEAPCDELIPCISKKLQREFLDGTQSTEPKEVQTDQMWGVFNMNAATEIAKRKQPKDFICSIAGNTQRSVSESNPDLMFVEYSIGYHNSWSPYRVYESQAIRHITMGIEKTENGDANHFWHQVIPNFFDPNMFHISEKEDFALYLGRLTELKGVTVACAIAEAAGIPLKVMGWGNKDLVIKGAEYIGAMDNVIRADYLSRARVLLCPSIYAEPFGSAAVEAQLSGTPVISTDFGAFTETVIHGKTGFRCNYLGEFADAVHNLDMLKSANDIRWSAIQRYSLEAVQPQYQAYFERLMLLWDKGFDTVETAYAFAQTV